MHQNMTYQIATKTASPIQNKNQFAPYIPAKKIRLMQSKNKLEPPELLLLKSRVYTGLLMQAATSSKLRVAQAPHLANICRKKKSHPSFSEQTKKLSCSFLKTFLTRIWAWKIYMFVPWGWCFWLGSCYFICGICWLQKCVGQSKLLLAWCLHTCQKTVSVSVMMLYI